MASKHLFKSKITDNTSTPLEQLGLIRREWDNTDACYKTYRYVRASVTAATSNGICLSCHVRNTGCTMVTNDISLGGINLPAGVAIGVITDQYYGWIQIGGYHSAIDTDAGDDLVDGDWAILHASTNGVCDRTAGGTAAVSKPIGVCVADDVDADDTVAVLLNCMFGDITQ